MTEEWLIDGYNLLYDLQSRKGGFSRDRLFALLAGFACEGRRVDMFLDGVGDDAEFRGHRTRWFEISYSQSVSADACIEKRLCERKGRAMLMVVTRDRAVAAMAVGSGARVLEPAEFLKALASADDERADAMFKNRVRGHGFNRPFEDKL